jgi:long-chain fatty acid transport protein
MKPIHAWRTAVATSALLSAGAWATDGYFPHGYGMKSKGMGGVSIAMTDHAFAGANNPALASFAGNRAEIGGDIFMPKRGASRSGSPGGIMDGDIDSDKKAFLVPEFGYNTPINDRVAVGLTVYGNGGMNTDYRSGNIQCMVPPAGPGTYAANMLCGTTRLGIDLMQLIVAPTVSFKLSERHAIGVSPLLVYQRFKAEGLQAFEGNPMMVAAAGQTTNNGYDSGTGFGVRIGYAGKPTDALTLGASWSPKTRMKKFDKYAQLFADGGNFDIPENLGLGAALQLTPALTVAADFTRIRYSQVPSVGNPSTNMALLGQPNGRGFGWSDIDVWKFGVQWQANPAWTLRAGVNVTGNPIQSRDVTFNILAPGVVTRHYTLGATYALGKDRELTLAYMYAPSNSVSGSSLLGQMSGQTFSETIRMSQRSLGLQYGWKF